MMFPKLITGLVLVVVASSCTSNDPTGDSSDPGVSTDVNTGESSEASTETNSEASTETSAVVGEGSGDSIAFCSLAADAGRAASRADFLETIDEMLTVAPAEIFADSALTSAAWANPDFESGLDADLDAAVERFVAYQLDECGIVAEATPPS